VLITVVEIIGGIMANSLALLSDAAHNLSDTIALLLAYIARRISGRTSNDFHFESHVDLEKDLEVSKTAVIRSRMEQILHDKFDIGHVTVQFEYDECDDKGIINEDV
jgi:Co/Zn/Cd efflux system component